MEQSEFDYMVMRSRATLAEIALKILLAQMRALVRGAPHEPIEQFQLDLLEALGMIERSVEEDLLQEGSDRELTPEDLGPVMEEFHRAVERLSESLRALFDG